MTEVNDRMYMKQYEKLHQDNSIKAQIERRLAAVDLPYPRAVVGRVDSQCFIMSLLWETGWLPSTLISLEKYISDKQQGLVFFKRLTTDGHMYLFTYGFPPAAARGFQLWILLNSYDQREYETKLLEQLEDGREILSQCLFNERDGWLDISAFTGIPTRITSEEG